MRREGRGYTKNTYWYLRFPARTSLLKVLKVPLFLSMVIVDQKGGGRREEGGGRREEGGGRREEGGGRREEGGGERTTLIQEV